MNNLIDRAITIPADEVLELFSLGIRSREADSVGGVDRAALIGCGGEGRGGGEAGSIGTGAGVVVIVVGPGW
jgi:hypothetical protein